MSERAEPQQVPTLVSEGPGYRGFGFFAPGRFMSGLGFPACRGFFPSGAHGFFCSDWSLRAPSVFQVAGSGFSADSSGSAAIFLILNGYRVDRFVCFAEIRPDSRSEHRKHLIAPCWPFRCVPVLVATESQ